MKKSMNFFFLTVLATLSLTAMAFAQTGMTGDKNMMVNEVSPDSTRAMMMQMSKNNEMMNRDFMKLQDHMRSMMKIDDMAILHSEMQKHMEMMKSMGKMMGEQDNMYRMMMGSEKMGHMHDMETMPRKTVEESKPESMKKEKKQ